MPRISAFDEHFSPAEQAKLAAWLDAHPTISVDEFRDLLAERGLRVGRSTAGRQKKRIEDLGRTMRQAHRVMDVFAEALEGVDDAKRGRALTELVGTIVFHSSESALERGQDVEPGEALELARALKELGLARRHNQAFADRERRLREELAEEHRRKDADAARDIRRGADPTEVLQRVRREIYGITDD